MTEYTTSTYEEFEFDENEFDELNNDCVELPEDFMDLPADDTTPVRKMPRPKHMDALNEIANLSVGQVIPPTHGELRSMDRFKANPTPPVVRERMCYTIEEQIEYEYGNYMGIGMIECAVCEILFPEICNADPGSTEAAIGVSHVCSHPECLAIAGGPVLIAGTDIHELLATDTEQLQDMLTMVAEAICCDGEDIYIEAILNRRHEAWVEYYQGREEYIFDEEDYSHYDEYDQEKDLSNEHWDNYWGDYNQCGIHVSY